MKKLLLIIALAVTAVYVTARTLNAGPDRTMATTPVSDAMNGEARKFSAALLELAEQGKPRDFGSRCANLKDERLLTYYRCMEQVAKDGYSFTGVETLRKQPDMVLVHLSNPRSGEFICTLKRSPKNHTYQFISFLPEDGHID